MPHPAQQQTPAGALEPANLQDIEARRPAGLRQAISLGLGIDGHAAPQPATRPQRPAKPADLDLAELRPACYFLAGKTLEALRPHQVAQLPYRVLLDHGLLEAAEAILERAKSAEDRQLARRYDGPPESRDPR